MDNFIRAEMQNRPKALAVLNSIVNTEDYEVVESPAEDKEHYDFAIKKKENEEVVALIEHKDRKYSSTTFDDWLLSSKKKSYLDSYSEPTYYLNTFTDGVWAMWNTKTTSSTRQPIYHSSCTVYSGSPMYENGYFYRIEDGMSGTFNTEEDGKIDEETE